MTLRKKVLPTAPLTVPLPPREPVWKGPTVDGVTQTMLSRYLTCPERFRILYVEGLQPNPVFRAPIEFGNLWHAAEEGYAEHGDLERAINPDETYWQRAVYEYGNKLGDLYPMQLDQIIHWIKVTIALFPTYMKYWRDHPDMLNRKPLLQEEKFCVDYKLPSGRTVKLRGKWDSVDLVTGPTSAGIKGGVNDGIWLQENKTKSQIDRQKIDRMLRFDLQTMLYLIALSSSLEQGKESVMVPWSDSRLKTIGNAQIKGVRYNVIRRSSHKTAYRMMKKVEEDIAADRAAEWFCRWNVEVNPQDIATFKSHCLDPILENVLDDYEWASHCFKLGKHDSPLFVQSKRHAKFLYHKRRHFIMPYIGYNPLSEGMETDVDNLLFTGSEVGLQRITHNQLFPELT